MDEQKNGQGGQKREVKRIFGVERNVFFLSLTSLLNDASNEMILSILPAFFISVLKSGAQALGIVEGVADAVANFIKIYSGRLSDKIEKRKIFAVAGYSLSVASRPFYLLAQSIGGIIGIRIVDRIGKGLREAPRDVLISLSTPPKEMGKSFGFHRGMDTIGAILGPLGAYFVLKLVPNGYSHVFIVAFVLGVLAVFSLFLVTEVVGKGKSKNWNLKAFGSLPKNYKTYLLSVFILSIGSLPLAVLLFRTKDIGFAIASIPLFYMVYNIFYSVLSLPAGKLADKLGDAKIISLGYLSLIVGYAVMALTTNLVGLLIAFFFIGAFSALTDGVQRAYVSNLVAEDLRGSAYGFLNAGIGFGALFAGIGGGFVWQKFGDVTALIVAVVVILVGLAVFTRTRKQIEN